MRKEYEHDVCNMKHLSNSTIMGWIETVKFINEFDEANSIAYMRNISHLDHLNKNRNAFISNHYLSFYDYIIDNISFFVPVESIIGLARDPKKYWNFRSEKFTQRNSYYH